MFYKYWFFTHFMKEIKKKILQFFFIHTEGSKLTKSKSPKSLFQSSLSNHLQSQNHPKFSIGSQILFSLIHKKGRIKQKQQKAFIAHAVSWPISAKEESQFRLENLSEHPRQDGGRVHRSTYASVGRSQRAWMVKVGSYLSTCGKVDQRVASWDSFVTSKRLFPISI